MSFDSRSTLIEALRTDDEDFILSNAFLPKTGSLKAVQYLFRLRQDLLQAAIDPEAAPRLPLPPTEPNYEELEENEVALAKEKYKEEVLFWLAVKDAHQRKVPLDKYLLIEEYLIPYFKTIISTSAIKATRFKAFTKTGEAQKKKAGLLGAVMGSNSDE